MKKILGLLSLVAVWCLGAVSACAQGAEVQLTGSNPVTIDGANVTGAYGTGVQTGNVSVTADGWLNATGRLNFHGALSVATGKTLTINSTTQGTTGGAQFTPYVAAADPSGTIILDSGSIEFNNGSWFGNATKCGNLIMKNGTSLKGWAVSSQNHYLNVEVPTGCTVSFYNYVNSAYNASFRIDGNLTGGGTINRQVETTAQNWWINLSGDNSGFTGIFNMITNGFTYLSSPTAGSANADWTMTSAAAVLASTGLADNSTVSLGTLSGSGTLQNDTNLVTFQVGAKNTNATFTGTIQNGTGAQLGLEKVGTATWTLDGATLNYTGPTTVTGGVLKVANTGDVSLGSAVTLGANGTLDLDAETYDVGDLTANGGTINLAINSENDYTRLTVDSITSQDYGFLNPVFGTGMNPYNFSYEVFTSMPTGLPENFNWDLLLAPGFRNDWSLVAQGAGLALRADPNAIPEPGAWVLLALGVLFLRWKSRRSQKF